MEHHEELKRRYEAAKKEAQEIQARIDRSAGRLEAAKRQYAELVAQAKQQFGVSSLAELEALVQRYEQENLQALQAFDEQASKVRAELDKIEAALDSAGV